jgi:hypothetical protein
VYLTLITVSGLDAGTFSDCCPELERRISAMLLVTLSRSMKVRHEIPRPAWEDASA